MSKQERDGILLDTHTWIWLFNGPQELSPKTIEEINKWGKQASVHLRHINMGAFNVSQQGKSFTDKTLKTMD